MTMEDDVLKEKEVTLVALGGGARNVCEDERERLNVVLGWMW